ncbi:MAG: hypothetical protein R2725_02870 [Solirubrobacterales bacterium]
MAEKTALGDEAAAIAAAVARFEAEMAPAAEPPAPAVNPWQRAALVEGVGARETIHDPQGGAGWLL